MSGPEALAPRRRRYRWLVALGFVLAVVAMVLGFLIALAPIGIGLILATSGRRNAGIAIVITTVVLVGVPRLIVLAVLDGRTYRIPGSAMEPGIDIGDRILALGDDTPERGDVFVFNPPVGAQSGGNQCGAPHPRSAACPRPTPRRAEDLTFIKRVVGLPGERLKIVRNRVYVNGTRLREDYARTTPCFAVCNLPREITIPPGHYFLLGDNRGESNDSRDWGPVPRSWLLRRAVLRYLPLSRFGGSL
ncbi:MAG: signal peptidase I [Thermoleophilaceae bacterium]